MVVREIDRCAQTFSAGELDPDNIEASLNVIADRFLRLVSSADVIAINRIIIGEVARSPALADVFWQAGPERIRIQVETFLHRAAKAGTLDIADARLATEQFASLVRGEIHLRNVLGLGRESDAAAISAAAANAVATFLKAFGTAKVAPQRADRGGRSVVADHRRDSP